MSESLIYTGDTISVTIILAAITFAVVAYVYSKCKRR